MAINVNTQDIDNYPGVVKRVTVDQEQFIPTGFAGDEQYAITISTSAYSDNTSNTAIQDLYIMEFDAGWCKSSGLRGTGGKFALDASNNSLKVKMDATISGTDGNGYYTIVLDHNNGLGIAGSAVAADMEEKIRSITVETGDAGYQLSYTNATVEFIDGKFWIVSGSIGRYYSGTYRSSVDVQPAATNDCTTILGFDVPVRSEVIDSQSVAETLIAADYTGGTTPLQLTSAAGITIGDCLAITDGVNTEYFPVLAISGTNITVPITGTNGFDGISNNYVTASGAQVQLLKMQDPDVRPLTYFDSVDSLVRYGLKNIINQIDYSS